MNVAIYARVSTQEQAINGHSIDEQIERMEKYCEAMNWSIFKTYVDAGCSGSNTNRASLQSMIYDIQDRSISKVLVYKLDRLSRSQKDTLELIEDIFLANGVDFVSITENFDTSTAFGKAIIGILAVFAQLEREQIKERLSMGKLARAKQGKFHGSSIAPIGYDYVDGELILNEYEALQIRSIYESYRSGCSMQKIMEDLNQSGYRHKYGEWNRITIRNILKKKTYLGYLVYDGTWYKGTHEPIISQELFNDVQSILSKKSHEHQKNNRRDGKITSYLGGILYCSKCGSKYSKSTRENLNDSTIKKHHRYYVCTKRLKENRKLEEHEKCFNKRWKMDELDEIIFNEIKKLALDPDHIHIKSDDERQKDRFDAVKSEISKIDNQILKLMDLFGVDGIPLDILQSKIESLNHKKLKLSEELEKIKEEEKAKLDAKESIKMIRSFGDVLDRGNFHEIRSLITGLIDRIDLDDEKITIHWTFN